MHATYRAEARNGEDTRASPTRGAARPRGAHGRVKEAKINCNLIRGSKPGPITIRCASSASTQEERSGAVPGVRRDGVTYTSRLRGLAANADSKIRVSSFKTRRRGNANGTKIYDIDRSGSTATLHRVPAWKILSFSANLNITMNDYHDFIYM